MDVVTPAHCPKSARNLCVTKDFVNSGFVLSFCFFEFSVVVGAFVIGLSQIFSFFFDRRA